MARQPGYLHDLPMFHTPFTRFMEDWFTFQKGPCADHEIDYARCAGTVGMIRAEKECSRYMDDFVECAWGVKSVSSTRKFLYCNCVIKLQIILIAILSRIGMNHRNKPWLHAECLRLK